MRREGEQLRNNITIIRREPMKIGILETGQLPPELGAKYGDYPDMFKRMLHGADPDIEFAVYRVTEEQLPGSVDECDAWLVTGSRHGVYDPLSWIEPLKRFLGAAYERGVPIVAICFGHQILAEALGGKARKSDKGWGLGVHHYPVRRATGWIQGIGETLTLNAFHQDQVTELPKDATVLAGSEFCPHAVLAYGDKAISIQPHPEFSTDFERDLIAYRRATSFSEVDADAALDSLDTPLDTERIAEWIVHFIKLSLSAQRQAS